MAFEFVLLIAQATVVFFIAAWLTTGVLENLFYPDLNRVFTAEVLDMTRMREAYPDAYARVAHRRISNSTFQNRLFSLIVASEILATLALWAGFGAMLLAILGQIEPETGRSLALLGALLFTSIWAGFLVVGNWFCYWFCHEGAQNTHYQMTLWGMAALILIAAG